MDSADENAALLEALRGYALNVNGRPALSPITLGLLHKFNNAITGVAFLAENCGMALDEDHPAQKDLAEISSVMRNALRFLDLIGEMHLGEHANANYFALDVLLSRQMDVLQSIVKKGTVVKFERPPSDLLVQVSESGFRQVLLHLVQNANEAMNEDKGATLWISGGVTPGASSPPFATVTIRDSGPGIDQSIEPRLFEPFVTTKDGKKHAGVGLYLARSVATASGWDLSARNHSEGGAEFTLRVPMEA